VFVGLGHDVRMRDVDIEGEWSESEARKRAEYRSYMDEIREGINQN